MEKPYTHLKPENRATLMLMLMLMLIRREGSTIRFVARILGRDPRTIVEN
jgi:hypothetical protein